MLHGEPRPRRTTVPKSPQAALRGMDSLILLLFELANEIFTKFFLRGVGGFSS